MPYDEKLAQRLSKAFSRRKGAAEKKMFGGIAYMVNGHMCCGIVDDLLMVRIGPDKYEDALEEKHTRAMDFTGRPMKGYVYVEPKGCKSDADLQSWIERGITFVKSLPPKKK
jgi:TfoX/Sxy family transcriptional regulator of competence genes